MKYARIRILAITALALTMLTGCAPLGEIMTNPNDDVLSPPDGLSTKPSIQLLDEALAQADELAQLVGGDWLDSAVPRRAFDPANPEQRAGWPFGACDMRGESGQYSIDIFQRSAPGTSFDPFAVVEKVRAHWKALGYQIRQIGPSEQDTTHNHSINVDRQYKAGMSFHASTKSMWISVQSECIKDE